MALWIGGDAKVYYRQMARKTDFAAKFAEIEAMAADVKASNWTEARKEMHLVALREEWKGLRVLQTYRKGA